MFLHISTAFVKFGDELSPNVISTFATCYSVTGTDMRSVSVTGSPHCGQNFAPSFMPAPHLSHTIILLCLHFLSFL